MRTSEEELSALKRHLRAETRPGGEHSTYSQCDCGQVSRTGMCKTCIEASIKKQENKKEKRNGC